MAKRQTRKKPNPIASSPKADEPTHRNPLPIEIVPTIETPKQKRAAHKSKQKWTWIGAVTCFFASVAAVGLQLLSYDNAPTTLKVITAVVIGLGGTLGYVNRQLHINGPDTKKTADKPEPQ